MQIFPIIGPVSQLQPFPLRRLMPRNADGWQIRASLNGSPPPLLDGLRNLGKSGLSNYIFLYGFGNLVKLGLSNYILIFWIDGFGNLVKLGLSNFILMALGILRNWGAALQHATSCNFEINVHQPGVR